MWKKIKNNSKDGERIKRLSLDEESKTECKKLIDYARNLVKTQFNRKTTFQRITKNVKGYGIRLVCSKNRICSTRWPVRFNIPNNIVSVVCNQVCEHQPFDRPGSLFLSFLIKIYYFKISSF